MLERNTLNENKLLSGLVLSGWSSNLLKHIASKDYPKTDDYFDVFALLFQYHYQYNDLSAIGNEELWFECVEGIRGLNIIRALEKTYNADRYFWAQKYDFFYRTGIVEFYHLTALLNGYVKPEIFLENIFSDLELDKQIKNQFASAVSSDTYLIINKAAILREFNTIKKTDYGALLQCCELMSQIMDTYYRQLVCIDVKILLSLFNYMLPIHTYKKINYRVSQLEVEAFMNYFYPLIKAELNASNKYLIEQWILELKGSIGSIKAAYQQEAKAYL